MCFLVFWSLKTFIPVDTVTVILALVSQEKSLVEDGSYVDSVRLFMVDI